MCFMSKDERILLKRAGDMYKRLPCGKRNTFADCLTHHGNELFFRFDTEDNSTHMLLVDLQCIK